ncbi:MAG: glycosyltransferase family 4 protein [Bacteroidetes bacterium]|nr:glycosyltransferase family 4 protein [Bacteroidota bacterium]
MEILIVTTRVPYPPHKGDKLKVYNIVKNLAGKNSVKVLCLYRKRSELEYLDNIRSLGADIEAIHHSFLRSAFNLLFFFFSKEPIQVLLYKSTRLARRLSEVVRENSPDVVYFHFIRSAQYIDSVPGSKTTRVLDFTDAVSLYLTRFANAEKNPFVKFGVGVERDRIAGYEKIAEKFDSCFICSPTDREYLSGKEIQADFRILPNGVDTRLFVKSERSYDEDRIIFTGNMPYFPNEDAAVYFAQVVMPIIWKLRPTAKFYIVGGRPTKKIRRLASDKIIVTGFVENIAAEYLKSAVAIAPMRFGAGTLNKVIEAIVLGLPVVATSIAVSGLAEEVKEFVEVADGPQDFAKKVAGFLAKHSGNTCHSEDDFEKVRRMLSWENIIERFADDLQELSMEKKAKRPVQMK